MATMFACLVLVLSSVLMVCSALPACSPYEGTVCAGEVPRGTSVFQNLAEDEDHLTQLFSTFARNMTDLCRRALTRSMCLLKFAPCLEENGKKHVLEMCKEDCYDLLESSCLLDANILFKSGVSQLYCRGLRNYGNAEGIHCAQLNIPSSKEIQEELCTRSQLEKDLSPVHDLNKVQLRPSKRSTSVDELLLNIKNAKHTERNQNLRLKQERADFQTKLLRRMSKLGSNVCTDEGLSIGDIFDRKTLKVLNLEAERLLLNVKLQNHEHAEKVCFRPTVDGGYIKAIPIGFVKQFTIDNRTVLTNVDVSIVSVHNDRYTAPNIMLTGSYDLCGTNFHYSIRLENRSFILLSAQAKQSISTSFLFQAFDMQLMLPPLQDFLQRGLNFLSLHIQRPEWIMSWTNNVRSLVLFRGRTKLSYFNSRLHEHADVEVMVLGQQKHTVVYLSWRKAWRKLILYQMYFDVARNFSTAISSMFDIKKASLLLSSAHIPKSTLPDKSSSALLSALRTDGFAPGMTFHGQGFIRDTCGQLDTLCNLFKRLTWSKLVSVNADLKQRRLGSKLSISIERQSSMLDSSLTFNKSLVSQAWQSLYSSLDAFITSNSHNTTTYLHRGDEMKSCSWNCRLLTLKLDVKQRFFRYGFLPSVSVQMRLTMVKHTSKILIRLKRMDLRRVNTLFNLLYRF